MTRLTDGNKTVTIEMVKWNGTGFDPDWSADFFEVGHLPYDEETDTYTVQNVDYCIDEAINETKKSVDLKDWFVFVNGEKIKLYKEYELVIDIDDICYGIEFDDFNEAKARMIDIYESWLVEEQINWECFINKNGDYIPMPTEKQIEDWDMMIENCTCWIAKWKEDEHTYYDEKMNYYFMSDEDANKINWLPWEELKKKYNW